jgi:hypothetical protein
MIFVQDNSVQSINAALNVIQKNQTPAQTSRGGRFSSSATNKFSISVSGNAISCYIPDFPELVANVTTVKLILPQLDTGSPTLNINGLGAKPIKVVRAGQLVDIIAHTGYWEGADSTSQRVWDNNTTLELIYDGTNWVVVGNPVLCSYFATDKSYSVYANGELEMWGKVTTSNKQGTLYLTVNTVLTGYSVMVIGNDNGTSAAYRCSVDNLTTTQCKLYTTLSNNGFVWYYQINGY